MARLILRYPNNVIREVDFEQPRYRIGSATDNDLVLEGEDLAPHQAEIESRDGTYSLTDVSENKSTTVNGKSVEKVSITYGDRIAFGPIIGLFYPPAKKKKMGERGRLFMYMILGGGVIVVAIALVLVFTTRQISTMISQPTGVAVSARETAGQPGVAEERLPRGGAAEGAVDEGIEGAPVQTEVPGKTGRFILFRPFGRGELSLPEPDAEEIEKRVAVAIPRGLRRLFFRKIPVQMASEAAPAEEFETIAEPEAVVEETGFLEEVRGPGEGVGTTEFLTTEQTFEEFQEELRQPGFFSGFLDPIKRLFGGIFGERETVALEEGVEFEQTFATAEEEAATGPGSARTSETAISADETRQAETGRAPRQVAPVKGYTFADTPVYSDEEQRQIETGFPSTIPALSNSETSNCSEVWTFSRTDQAETRILRSGMIGKINDDRYQDYVFSTSTNELVAVDGRMGTELIRQDLGSPFLEPIITDVDGDRDEDFVVVFENGEIITFSKDLEPVWRYAGTGRITTLPVLVDINNDRIHDLVFATLDMDVIALDGSTGFELWRFFDAETEIVHAPVSLFLNNDRTEDVVFSTRRGILYAIDGSNGWGLWRKALPGRLAGPPCIGDLDGDHERDIVVLTRDGTLSAYGRDGRLLFSWKTEGSYSVPPTIGDTDGDGRNDIVLMNTEGLLRVFEGSTRREKWSILSQEGPITGRIALADLEEDGAMEVVLPSLSGAVLVLNGVNGEIRGLYNCGSRIWTTPLIRDLNRDRIKEIVVGTEGGELFALQVAGSRKGFLSFRSSFWVATHHDVQNTGYAESRFIFSPWK